MNYAIVLASGTGSRTGLDLPKQFLKINGKTILEYTLNTFNKNKLTDKIILVVGEEYIENSKTIAKNFTKISEVTTGGKTRQESSYNGVFAVKEDNAKILIHDACRPFINDELINRCYYALDKYNAIDTGIETSDTIIEVDSRNIVTKTLKRQTLRRCQTPQGFISGLIKKAHSLARKKNIKVTDDVSLIVSLNLDKVFVVDGEIENIKITYPDDIKYAKERLF